MNIAVLIMSTNSEPSVSNLKAMKDTFIRYADENAGNLEHTYTFVEYKCDSILHSDYDGIPKARFVKSKDFNNFYECFISEKESVYRTFEKTYSILKNIDSFGEFDFIVRINISCYFNIRLFDRICGMLEKGIVYSSAYNTIVSFETNYLNDVFPRGDFFIISDKHKNAIIEYGKKYLYCDMSLSNRIELPHVDDVLIGVCYIDAFGKDYIYMMKNFIYGYHPENKKFKVFKNDPYCLAIRVKTIPDGVSYSGYSWDDNPYRRYDCEKMKLLHEFMTSNDVVDIADIKNIMYEKGVRKNFIISAGETDDLHVFYMINEQKRRS